jgi:hypothetical protein
VTIATKGQFHLSPIFLLRLSGSDSTILDELSSSKLTEWAAQCIATEESIAHLADGISDRMSELIGGESDQAKRRMLVNLRRNVFTGKSDRVDPGAEYSAQLGADLSARVLSWKRLMSDHAALRESGAQLWQRVACQDRATVLRHTVVPFHAVGVQMASPALDRTSEWLESRPAEISSKRGRDAMRSYAQYLYRSSTKASPFSTFASVAIGELGEGDDGPLVDVQTETITQTSFPRLNVSFLVRLRRAILSSRELRRDLVVTPVEGWSIVGDRVRYVRRSASLSAGIAKSFEAVREDVFFLRNDALLARTLQVLGSAEKRSMQAVAGCNAEEIGIDMPAVEFEEYLVTLVGLNLLVVPALDVGLHATRPEIEFAAGLRTVRTAWADRIANSLERMSSLATAIGNVIDPVARRGMLSELRLTSREIMKGVAPSAESEAFEDNLVFEDVRSDLDVISGNGQAWANGAEHCLSRLLNILPVFDLLLPEKLLVGRFFDLRFGSYDEHTDVLRFLQELREDVLDDYRPSAQLAE